MHSANRAIYELLADYADALRDARMDTLVQSLTPEEAGSMAASTDFTQAAGVARLLNVLAFSRDTPPADSAVFISRINTSLLHRQKKRLRATTR